MTDRSLTREGYLGELPTHTREDREGNTVVITGCCWDVSTDAVKFELFSLDVVNDKTLFPTNVVYTTHD